MFVINSKFNININVPERINRGRMRRSAEKPGVTGNPGNFSLSRTTRKRVARKHSLVGNAFLKTGNGTRSEKKKEVIIVGSNHRGLDGID